MRVGRRDIEWMVPLLTALLVGFGALVVYSAAQSTDPSLFTRQIVYIIAGTVLFIGAAMIPDRLTFAFAHIFYMFVLLLLLLVLFVGSGPTGRWLVLGPYHMQPSELAKLATILAVARFMADRRNDIHELKHLLTLAFLAGLPFVLIAIEPDLGTSVVIPFAAGMVAFWGGLPLIAMVLVISPLAVMITRTTSPFLRGFPSS